jgi:1-deoxy-D-xylulose-5-phosphate reductoisomerase
MVMKFETKSLKTPENRAFYTAVAAAEHFMRLRMNGRYHDLIALIQFGNDAYVVTPFTTDYQNVMLSMTLVSNPREWGRFNDWGTTIIQGIEQGTQLFKTFNFLNASGNLMLVFTDGRDHPKGLTPTHFRLTGGQNAARLAELAIMHRAELAVIADPGGYTALRDRLAGTDIEVGAGEDALLEAASRPADWIMAAIVGAAGLKPTLQAVRQGTLTALANKECLVCAGDIFMTEVERAKTTLLPVDSEHSAAMQVMTGTQPERIELVCLTASGGPFRSWSREQMRAARPEQALNHPNWSMGPKVTIDSATLMNKGLEVIEARWLFDVPGDRIRVAVHEKSVVHSLVEFVDGSFKAQLGVTDMRHPIQYALTYPDRKSSMLPPFDLVAAGPLGFALPDTDRFPCLALGYEALALGGAAPAVLNAANEVAVAAFLAGRAGFLDIPAVIRGTLDRHAGVPAAQLTDILTADRIARKTAADLLASGVQS